MALEFAGPFLLLLGSHLVIWRDPFALLVSLITLHTWYAVDHSENLRLFHYDHHKHVDSVYTIYTRIRFNAQGERVATRLAKDDEVKALLKRDSVRHGTGPYS